MRSWTVGELKDALQDVPNDYIVALEVPLPNSLSRAGLLHITTEWLRSVVVQNDSKQLRLTGGEK